MMVSTSTLSIVRGFWTSADVEDGIDVNLGYCIVWTTVWTCSWRWNSLDGGIYVISLSLPGVHGVCGMDSCSRAYFYQLL